jgi:hypothetical protein
VVWRLLQRLHRGLAVRCGLLVLRTAEKTSLGSHKNRMAWVSARLVGRELCGLFIGLADSLPDETVDGLLTRLYESAVSES